MMYTMKRLLYILPIIAAMLLGAASLSAQTVVKKVDAPHHSDLDERVIVGKDTVSIVIPEPNFGRYDRGLFNYLFIPKGNIVSIVGRNGYKYSIDAQDTEFGVNKPLVVLVDGTSASASEILSGALKDYHKAVLVGSRTFGKGMVQKIIPLPNETGINLTIAKYLTPTGHDINNKGIEPDVNVEFSIKDINNKTDSQINTAKQILNKMIATN